MPFGLELEAGGPPAVSASTLVVLHAAPDGSGAACSLPAPCLLEEALADAADGHAGDTVRVELAAGVYTAATGPYALTIPVSGAPLAVSLFGPLAPDGATIDSGGKGPDLTIESSGSTAVNVIDLTLTGGAAPLGGAIDVNSLGSTLHVVGSTLFGDTATTTGGGIYLGGGAAVIEGSTIVDDTAGSGSGGSGGAIDVAASGSASLALEANVVADDGSSACAGAPVVDEGYDITDSASCLGSSPGIGSTASATAQQLFGGAPSLQPAGSAGAVVPLQTSGDPAFDDVPSSLTSLTSQGTYCAGTDERGAERLQGSAASCSSGADQFAPAVVQSLAPQSAAPGTVVNVQGSGFLLETALLVGGRPVAARVTSDDALSFTVPALAEGAVPVVVDAPDGNGAAPSGLAILAPLSFASLALPAGEAGAPYDTVLAATGGQPPYSWSVGALPAGLALDSAGELSGTPQQAGSDQLEVTVKDANQLGLTGQLTVAVAPGPSVVTSSLPPGRLGRDYAATLEATGGTPPYSWSIPTGTLPLGLILGSGGTLSGRPGATGTLPLEVQVTDALGSAGVASLEIAVGRPPLPAERFAALGARGDLAVGGGPDLRLARRGRVAGVAAAPRGWWVATVGGRVLAVGGARGLGSLHRRRPAAPVVAIAASGRGYVLLTRAGSLYGFRAAFEHQHLPRAAGPAGPAGPARVPAAAPPRQVALACTRGGCWVLSSNGAVAAVGRVPALGGLQGRRRIGRPVAIAADAAGTGYWVVTGAGDVYSFGSARPRGQLRPSDHAGAAVAIAAAPLGEGYWLLTRRGRVFGFGSARLLAVGSPSTGPTRSPAGEAALAAGALALAGGR